VWASNRLGRNLRHFVLLLDDYEWFQIRLADRRLGRVLSKYVGEHGMRRFCFSSIGAVDAQRLDDRRLRLN
jgi:hypothetical protein